VFIPASFQAAYEAEMVAIDAIREIGGTRLRSLCETRHWLFDERIKEQESLLAKVQLGRFNGLRDVPDFYAAVVVVPTRNQLQDAVDSVCALFRNPAVVRERNMDPLKFPYDDIHVVAVLGASPIVPESAADRQFEVQIRTGLEYAWWWATHDTVYKGGLPDWAVQRLASQARASLELLDAILADLHGAARLQSAREVLPDPQLEEALALASLWVDAQQPKDLRRFAETVIAFAGAVGLPVSAVRSMLEDPANSDVVGLPSVTPAQACLVAMMREIGQPLSDRFGAAGLRIFLSPEMTEVCPEMSAIVQDRLVQW
jgi:ppGpp synthetase/RelA/SpoT-type nucleotidyltranferase